MEAVLSPREHALFTTLPELLGKRFEQRQAQDAAQDWRGFQREVRNVQLAELDARFLPIDGLQAVSYTHLDVYKRQPRNCPAAFWKASPVPAFCNWHAIAGSRSKNAR